MITIKRTTDKGVIRTLVPNPDDLDIVYKDLMFHYLKDGGTVIPTITGHIIATNKKVITLTIEEI